MYIDIVCSRIVFAKITKDIMRNNLIINLKGEKKMKKRTLGILGFIVSIAGFIVSQIGNIIDDKKISNEIEEKVDEALARKTANDEENSENEGPD